MNGAAGRIGGKTVEIRDIGKQYGDYVVRLRREFHAMPELSHREYETGARVLRELAALGIEGRRAADTGVLAEIRGGGGAGRCVALRADMDALPVTECTGVSYASRTPGVMHACGHDCHIAMLLGAAAMLQAARQTFPGTVRLIFEPAEEPAQGAAQMIEAGAMTDVDTVFGLHVWDDVPAGKISAEAGPRMASADFFTIDITGKSCHGSRPDQGVDAVTAGAALVNGFQTLVSREISPLEPAVITVGEFKAGEADNVVAGHAFLSGTTRAFCDPVRDSLPDRMERVVRGVAEAFRAEIRLHYRRGSPPVINDPVCAARAARAVERVLGPDVLCHMERTTAGEDFSEYLRLAPGCFAFVGTHSEALGTVYPNHSCRYAVDESVLPGGAMTAAQYALDFLTG